MKGCIVLVTVMMLAACTKEGDTIYQWNSDEPKASTVPLIVSNPEDLTVVGAAKGFSDGFFTDYYRVEYDESYMIQWEKHLETFYLAEHSGEGYNIADSTALRLLDEVTGTIVPICVMTGGRFCDHSSKTI